MENSIVAAEMNCAQISTLLQDRFYFGLCCGILCGLENKLTFLSCNLYESVLFTKVRFDFEKPFHTCQRKKAFSCEAYQCSVVDASSAMFT